MRRSATDLRAHLYEVLDHVAKTGEPVHVTRGGVELSIVRTAAAPKKRKKPRVIPQLIAGDPDALVHVEWPWSQGRDL
jgi:prevent-host-death family protein